MPKTKKTAASTSKGGARGKKKSDPDVITADDVTSDSDDYSDTEVKKPRIDGPGGDVDHENGSSANGTKTNNTKDSSSALSLETASDETKALFAGDAGRLVICGGINWDLIGRKELPKAAKNAAAASASSGSGKDNLWGPHVWDSDIRIREIVSSCCACHSVIITTDGKALTFGRNDKGQLGLGDLVTRAIPEVVKALEGHNIVSAACGKGHTLFLTDKGTVYAAGDNKMGQIGNGSQGPNPVLTPVRVNHGGKPIVRVAAGGEFSLIVDAFGGLYSFGSPEYGQLGHNSEGKYFTTGNKIAYHCETSPRRVVLFIEKTREGHTVPVEDVSVVEVAAGVNHALCVDSKKRCFSWGFGGYGRLGHSETKNELMPRNVKNFDYAKRGAKKVWCGSTSSLALDESGLLYFWGQTKMTGEANMYPKLIQDLCGWNIRSVAHANKSIVVVADNSVISWGPAPTYGELGYGESKSKSSTTPQEVKLLAGVHVKKVSCGYGHTLMIARDDNPEDEEKINKLPKWP